MSDEQMSLFEDLKPRKMGRVLNWKPSMKDHRDKLFTAINPTAHQAVPTVMDLRALCPPIYDQGQIGSCTGQALAGAIEFLQLKELTTGAGLPQEYSDKYEAVSRLFIYWNERAIEGSTAYDQGATSMRDGCIALNQKGVCREINWPYDPSKVFLSPPAQAYQEALEHLLALYYTLGFEDIHNCLIAGYPVTLGLPLYQSFMSAETSMTGVVKEPGWFHDPQVGGHAMLIVGYDDREKHFIVRNSWGTGWGDKGCCYIPYSYVERQGSDFFTLRLK